MSYCSATDVLNGPLKGIDLTSLGDATAQRSWVATLLPATKLAIDAAAGRDFGLHANDEVTLDGTGADRLAVWRDDRTLCVPIVEVTAVSVYGQAQDLTELKVDQHAGIIGWQRSANDRLAQRRAVRGGSLSRFPRDFQNVQVTLTWGYADVPEDVQLAQACATAALTVITLGGGISGGLLRKAVEDYEVQYGEGQYRQQVREWVARATSLLFPYRTGRRSG